MLELLLEFKLLLQTVESGLHGVEELVLADLAVRPLLEVRSGLHHHLGRWHLQNT